jgi:hypothetical protein
VLVCRSCRTCLSPAGAARWKDHLYREPHRLAGAPLSKTIQLLTSMYGDGELRSVDELRRHRPSRRSPCARVAGLDTSPGYLCLANVDGCDFATTRLVKMHDHMLPAYGVRAVEHDRQVRPLWRACTLQTYFTAKGRIDYFVVADSAHDDHCGAGSSGAICCCRQQAGPSVQQGQPPSSPERALLKMLRADAMQARRDMDEAASLVQDAGEGRADMEAWAVRMGLAGHLHGLRDDEIRTSYQLLAS